MKKLEVKEIKLPGPDIYISGSYPSDGIYLVTDITNMSNVVDRDNTLVNVRLGGVIYIGEEIDIKFIEEKKEEKAQMQISEDFFLKTLSLVVNKDESYKK